MFTLQDAALAYAKGAERILGEDGTYINNNQELVPVFVSLLFQSLEISLKHLGLETKLFTKQEARDRKLTKKRARHQRNRGPREYEIGCG